jgi:hypothetical protein
VVGVAAFFGLFLSFGSFPFPSTFSLSVNSINHEVSMKHTYRLKYLRIALVVFGAIMAFGFYPLTLLWPSGWIWHQGQSDYLMMILGIYATLGVFLLVAARDPLKHLSLIWFTVWSSLVHGAIMAFQSLSSSDHVGHLLGDVPALLIVAMVLALLTPRGDKSIIAHTET